MQMIPLLTVIHHAADAAVVRHLHWKVEDRAGRALHSVSIQFR